MITIGAGRVGSALRLRARARGQDCVCLGRGDDWSALDGPKGSPILLTVRAGDLRGVIERVPRRRHDDLVVLQNGALRDHLDELRIGEVTRGVLYVWAATRDADFTAARWTPLTGPHADEVERWFAALDLPAEAVHPLRYAVYEVEKLVWLTTNGWLCRARDCAVGELPDDEVHELVAELLPVTRAAWGVDLPADWVTERVLAWSRAIPTFRASTSEDEWRGGWFVAEAERWGVPLPLLTHLRR